MGFSDKMGASLGAEGARLEVKPAALPLERGTSATATVTIIGGTKPAMVEALTLRVVEARRIWHDPAGRPLSESEAAAAPDRSQLRPSWNRTTLSERRVTVGAAVEAGHSHELSVEFDIPATSGATAADLSHTLHVQADIRGQIDPSGTARLAFT